MIIYIVQIVFSNCIVQFGYDLTWCEAWWWTVEVTRGCIWVQGWHSGVAIQPRQCSWITICKSLTGLHDVYVQCIQFAFRCDFDFVKIHFYYSKNSHMRNGEPHVHIGKLNSRNISYLSEYRLPLFFPDPTFVALLLKSLFGH